MSTDDKINRIREEILTQYSARLNAVLSLCESPIEKLFLLNFINYFESKWGFDTNVEFMFDVPDREVFGEIFIPDAPMFFNRFNEPSVPIGIKVNSFIKIKIIPQKKVIIDNKEYRVDFLLEITRFDNSTINLCLECDGFEFHGRTIEQVNRDNARDRDFMKLHSFVFRYSGSEIYKFGNFNDFKEVVEHIIATAMYDLKKNHEFKIEKELLEYKIENNLTESQYQELRLSFGLPS